MGDDSQREELHLLLPSPSSLTQASHHSFKPSSSPPKLDLSLSLSIGSNSQPSPNKDKVESKSIIKLAQVERAYVKRVREVTRRELELAEKEFARARMIWEWAQEDMEKVERMKAAATRRVGLNCIGITCQSCRQRFQP